MNDQWQQFERLARRARDEAVPPLDVTPQVLRRLALGAPDTQTNRTLAIFTLIGAAAAMVALGLTIWTWSNWTDPLGEMFTQTLTVML
jgi:ferric-dicitrate binding protein FerR (iron transport regulator)